MHRLCLHGMMLAIIRENYVEVQATWAVYMNEAENLERMESYGKCYSQIR